MRTNPTPLSFAASPASRHLLPFSGDWRDLGKSALWKVPGLSAFRETAGTHAFRDRAFAQADAVLAAYQEAVDRGLAPAVTKTKNESGSHPGQDWRDLAKSNLWSLPSLGDFKSTAGTHAHRDHAFAQADAVMAAYQTAVNRGIAPAIVRTSGAKPKPIEASVVFKQTAPIGLTVTLKPQSDGSIWLDVVSTDEPIKPNFGTGEITLTINGKAYSSGTLSFGMFANTRAPVARIAAQLAEDPTLDISIDRIKVPSELVELDGSRLIVRPRVAK